MQAQDVVTTIQNLAFQTARVSETGGRPNNEDYCDFAQVDQFGCWVVADGLGGHNGGEMAASTAAHVVIEQFRANPEISAKALESHIAAAQEKILHLQQQDAALKTMRTTLVVLISDSRSALWAHVGDSRLYRFQSRGLISQTEDHSVPQSLVKAGEITADKIRGHVDRNRLLRSLGEPGTARPSVMTSPAPLDESDAFLLCTDGFWEHVLEIEMLADLAASATPDQWLARSVSRLRRRVRGEYDNYSALAIFYTPNQSSTSGSAGRPELDYAASNQASVAELRPNKLHGDIQLFFAREYPT
jgi:PPM family protein phosphatase